MLLQQQVMLRRNFQGNLTNVHGMHTGQKASFNYLVTIYKSPDRAAQVIYPDILGIVDNDTMSADFNCTSNSIEVAT